MAMTQERYRTITVKEACQILGLGKTKVYEMLADGTLPGYRIGNVWRTTDKVCYDLIEERMQIQRLVCESKHRRRS